MRRLLGVLTFLILLSASPTTAGAAAPGGFKQLADPLGCLRGDNNAGGVCTLASDVFGGWEIAVSPDSKNVYAISEQGDNIMIFDRNPSTGTLTRKAGRNGCSVNGADTATCRGVRHLDGPLGMVFNPNGSTLYVSTYTGPGAGVLTFDRASNGVITQRPGGEGCIANNFIAGDCNDARAMASPRGLATDDQGKTLYVADAGTDAITALAINPADGTLSQISDTATEFGCVESTPSECGGDGRAMGFPWSVDVSPDGNFVYLGTISDHSVVGFARNPSTGRIKPLAAPGGCLDAEGTDGCTVTPELSAAFDLQVGTGAGSQIYVSSQSQNRVLVIDRSGSTLTRRASSSGCVSQTAAASCGDGDGMTAPEGLGLSPDGQHLYVATADGVAELSRTSSGGLTPRSGSRFCVTDPAQAPCATLRGLAGFQAVTVSGDGRSIYAQTPFGDRGLGVFKRDSATPACSNGSATVAAGSVTALPLSCTDADGDALTRSITAPPGLGVLSPVDQGAGQVMFASSGVPGSTSFKFRASSNGVQSNQATFTINIPAPPGPGPGPGPGPTVVPVLSSTTSINSLAFKAYTKLLNLAVKNLPAGATVRVTCKTKKKKKQKKGCAYKSKRFTTSGARAKLNLRKPFAKKKIPVGTKITITITAPGFLGKQIQYTMRKGKIPKSRVRCLSASGKAGSCA